MFVSLDSKNLASYVASQVSMVAPDTVVRGATLTSYIDKAFERVEYCFSHIRIKHFYDGKSPRFDHLHTDQYAIFLYFVANTIYRMEGDLRLAAKMYMLNKALHAIDVFYEVELPDIFAFQHPVGTVLGRARYTNGLLVYQRCSVGSNLQGQSPMLGEGVVMFGGSTIIGNCRVGSNCWLSVGAVLMDSDAPMNSVVFGQSPHHVIKTTKRSVFKDYFSPKND